MLNERELKYVVNDLSHVLGSCSYSFNMVSSLVVKYSCMFGYEESAETINDAKRASKVVRHRIREGFQLGIHGLLLSSSFEQLLLCSQPLSDVQEVLFLHFPRRCR